MYVNVVTDISEKGDCVLLLRSSSEVMLQMLRQEVEQMERRFPSLELLRKEVEEMRSFHSLLMPLIEDFKEN